MKDADSLNISKSYWICNLSKLKDNFFKKKIIRINSISLSDNFEKFVLSKLERHCLLENSSTGYWYRPHRRRRNYIKNLFHSLRSQFLCSSADNRFSYFYGFGFTQFVRYIMGSFSIYYTILNLKDFQLNLPMLCYDSPSNAIC